MPSAPVATGRCTTQEQEVLRRFMLAWQRYDIDALAALLRDDAVLHMHPSPFATSAARRSRGSSPPSPPTGDSTASG